MPPIVSAPMAFAPSIHNPTAVPNNPATTAAAMIAERLAILRSMAPDATQTRDRNGNEKPVGRQFIGVLTAAVYISTLTSPDATLTMNSLCFEIRKHHSKSSTRPHSHRHQSPAAKQIVARP